MSSPASSNKRQRTNDLSNRIADFKRNFPVETARVKAEPKASPPVQITEYATDVIQNATEVVRTRNDDSKRLERKDVINLVKIGDNALDNPVVDPTPTIDEKTVTPTFRELEFEFIGLDDAVALTDTKSGKQEAADQNDDAVAPADTKSSEQEAVDDLMDVDKPTGTKSGKQEAADQDDDLMDIVDDVVAPTDTKSGKQEAADQDDDELTPNQQASSGYDSGIEIFESDDEVVKGTQLDDDINMIFESDDEVVEEKQPDNTETVESDDETTDLDEQESDDESTDLDKQESDDDNEVKTVIDLHNGDHVTLSYASDAEITVCFNGKKSAHDAETIVDDMVRRINDKFNSMRNKLKKHENLILKADQLSDGKILQTLKDALKKSNQDENIFKKRYNQMQTDAYANRRSERREFTSNVLTPRVALGKLRALLTNAEAAVDKKNQVDADNFKKIKELLEPALGPIASFVAHGKHLVRKAHPRPRLNKTGAYFDQMAEFQANQEALDKKISDHKAELASAVSRRAKAKTAAERSTKKYKNTVAFIRRLSKNKFNVKLAKNETGLQVRLGPFA
jgi:hypothetical protein